MKYEVDIALLQKILEYIGSSTSTLPTVKVVTMVDELRNLKPIKEKDEQEKVGSEG